MGNDNGNGNGSTTYTGFDKRVNGDDRRDHQCLHEGDFGEMKSDLKNLGSQFTSHVEDQKDRNKVVDTKFDGISTCLTDLSAAQVSLPGQVIAGLAKEKKEKRAQFSNTITTISKVLGLLVTVGGGLWWLFTFVANNSVAAP